MLGGVLINIAREAISDQIYGTQTLDMQGLVQEYGELAQQRATFVTLTLEGELRGCIGSIVPHRALLEDLVSNARSAAFKDPRFRPLNAQEFKKVNIEVSVLSQPERFEYESVEQLKQRVTHDDGVILKDGPYQATFLPQVWEQLPSFELFFSHLCQKAGRNLDCLKSIPEIQLYRVEKYKE